VTSRPAKECTCELADGAQGILLYGVVSFDWVKKQFFLHAIDRTRDRAEAHKAAVMSEHRLKETRGTVRIETFESDHAFAEMMKI
jgi:hypothetical protein